ncbi:hypothetical protein E0Z10_g9983 [Xylaria hypoxylon]|uniref:CCHC-type domain-containing protein n=1 Tax=Xylaria hypoxylon TaxID=37992 RepID=A0A4Z0YFT7_9PEZI|nr:hypothetical protein E0Z10_g9983 [Xylaria hypoxylon]
MSTWAPVRDDVCDGPSNSTAAQWNDGPADDKWNDNAGANGGRVTAPFDEGGVNGFDAAAGGDDARGGGGGGTCFNCGQEGHNKVDCPNPRVQKCRHCDEEGHMVRDCPTAPPREFTGECRHCHEEGHMAKDCPTKPAEVCRNCQEEVVECKNPRKIDRSHLKEVDAEIAWNKISEGVRENDMDDVKEAIQLYVKACPDTTYVDLEIAFRTQEIGIYLIAMESQSMMSTLTNMDLQGNLDKKYRVNYRFDPKPARPREREFWPKDKEENMSRLEDAGEPVNRGLSKCTNCDELGHISKNCPQEKMEKERVVIMCFNCNEPGHRMRDCLQQRVDKFACKNCGKGGHKAADCPEPRVAGPDVECRKCGETGHFSRDCPQGGGGGGGGGRGCFNCGEEGHSARDCTEPKKMICRNCNQEGHRSNECPEPKDMSKVQCRNCDEYGHDSRECPKPRDYSRVQCQNCGEFGHTKIRCNKQTVAPDDFGGGSTGNIGNDSFKAGGGGNEEAREPASDDWMKEAAGNSGAAGNGGWNASGPGEVVW